MSVSERVKAGSSLVDRTGVRKEKKWWGKEMK